MMPHFELEKLREEVEALRREIASLSKHALELRRELRRSTDNLGGRVNELAERGIELEGRVTGHDVSFGALAENIKDILQSRVWRTLTRLGGVALRLQGDATAAGAEAVAPSEATGGVAGATLAGAPSYELWQSDYERQDDLDIAVRLASLLTRPRFAIISAEDPGPQSYANYEVHDSEAALAGSTAEWAIRLEPGDRLAPAALLAIAEAVNRDPNASAIYSDHDYLDASGRRVDPVFKPEWSRERFRGEDYVSRAVAFRCPRAFRLSADEAVVAHVPEVLFHLRRTGRAAEIGRVRRALPAEHRVSMIIPSGGHLEILRQCLDSILAQTRYDDFEIVVADNSRDAAVEDYLKSRPAGAAGIRRLDFRGRAFNFSAMANESAAACASPYLLFLNDDTTVAEPDWITGMVELAALPDAGAVGALLLFPDGRIQHAGVTLGINGLCEHTLLRCSLEQASARAAQVIREVSAVTGACMMISAARFREMGGFDAERFPINFNDIDLCLRLRRAGHRILYTPHARLVHHEAFTRTRTGQASLAREELEALHARWPGDFDTDPYYNPNLNHDQADYTLRRRPWQPYSRTPKK